MVWRCSSGNPDQRGDARCEFVSQIDKFFLAENFLDLSEGDVRAFLAGRPEWRSSGQ